MADPSHRRHHNPKQRVLTGDNEDEVFTIKEGTKNELLSNTEAFFLCVEGSLTIGIVNLPCMISRVGYITAVFLYIIIFIMASYGNTILISVNKEMSDRFQVTHVPYIESLFITCSGGPKLIKHLASYIKFVAMAFLITMPLTSCALMKLYVVYTLSGLYPLSPNHHLSVMFYLGITLLFFYYVNSFGSLRQMVIPSVVSFLSLFTFITLLFYIMFYTDPGIGNNVQGYGQLTYLPVFITQGMSVAVAVSVKIIVAQNLRDPAEFFKPTGISISSMFASSLVYMSFGFICYLKHGQDVRANVILNIHNDRLSWCLQFFFMASLFFSYPLHLYPVFKYTWYDWLQYIFPESEHLKMHIWHTAFHITITISTALLDLFVPKLNTISTALSIVSVCFIGFFFPALMEYSLIYRKTKEILSISQLKDFILMLVSMVLMVASVMVLIVHLDEWVEEHH